MRKRTVILPPAPTLRSGPTLASLGGARGGRLDDTDPLTDRERESSVRPPTATNAAPGGGCLVVLGGGEGVGAHGSLQNMACSGMFGAWHEKRTHNSVEGEPITSAPTVGRDLGKWRCAQRFLVVPW
jgi:hypothetical protein